MRLIRALAGVLAAGLAAVVLLLAAGQQAALAGGGPGSGGPVGSVSCGQPRRRPGPPAHAGAGWPFPDTRARKRSPPREWCSFACWQHTVNHPALETA
jgi:hypothetical protein